MSPPSTLPGGTLREKLDECAAAGETLPCARPPARGCILAAAARPDVNTRSGGLRRSPVYMAPERGRGLAGATPFHGSDKPRPGVDPRLAAVVAKTAERSRPNATRTPASWRRDVDVSRNQSRIDTVTSATPFALRRRRWRVVPAMVLGTIMGAGVAQKHRALAPAKRSLCGGNPANLLLVDGLMELVANF